MNLKKTSILVLCGLLSFDASAATPMTIRSGGTLNLGATSGSALTTGLKKSTLTKSSSSYSSSAARAGVTPVAQSATTSSVSDSTIEALTARIAAIENLVYEKDNIIASLQARLTQYDDMIYDLENQIARYEDEFKKAYQELFEEPKFLGITQVGGGAITLDMVIAEVGMKNTESRIDRNEEDIAELKKYVSDAGEFGKWKKELEELRDLQWELQHGNNSTLSRLIEAERLLNEFKNSSVADSSLIKELERILAQLRNKVEKFRVEYQVAIEGFDDRITVLDNGQKRVNTVLSRVETTANAAQRSAMEATNNVKNIMQTQLPAINSQLNSTQKTLLQLSADAKKFDTSLQLVSTKADAAAADAAAAKKASLTTLKATK